MQIRKSLLACLSVVLSMSCQHEDTITGDLSVRFSLQPVSANKSGGRVAGNVSPVTVIVTILDKAGNTVAERTSLRLYRFGDNYLSAPLTLKISGSSYRLSEFYVTDSTGAVAYATPREGSKLAYLVSDPLDIVFNVNKNQITTVTPEVLAVSDKSNAEDFGYGQFGLNVIKTISATFSCFIKGAFNFELTDAKLTIEALNDTLGHDTIARWKYETVLAAQANTLILRQFPFYRVTATKSGYAPWQQYVALKDGDRKEILFLQKQLSRLKSIDGMFIYYSNVYRYIKYEFDYDNSGRPSSERFYATYYDGSSHLGWNTHYYFGNNSWPDSVYYHYGLPPYSAYDYNSYTALSDGGKLHALRIKGNDYPSFWSFAGDQLGRLTSTIGPTSEDYSYGTGGDLKHVNATYLGRLFIEEDYAFDSNHSNVFTPHMLSNLLKKIVFGFGSLEDGGPPIAFPVILFMQNKLISSFTFTQYNDSVVGKYTKRADFTYVFDNDGRPVNLSVDVTYTVAATGVTTKTNVINNAALTYY